MSQETASQKFKKKYLVLLNCTSPLFMINKFTIICDCMPPKINFMQLIWSESEKTAT